MQQAVPAGGAETIIYDIDADVALVVGEANRGSEAARRSATQSGFRVRPTVDADTALRDLALLDGVQLVLFEAEDMPAAAAEALLARLGGVMEDRQLRLIATLAPEQIDLAAGLLPVEADLQCAPSDADRLAAAMLARTRLRPMLRDGARDEEALRMRRFQEEVARIADSLSRLTRGEWTERPAAGVRAAPFSFHAEAGPPDISPQEIRRVIRARRMRAECFDAELFADPAWDMLLDLFAAELERERVSVSSLCIAAAVPPTTALRWIGTMNEAGLFERRADPHDRRRAYIGLSDRAREGMHRFVAAVKRAGLTLV